MNTNEKNISEEVLEEVSGGIPVIHNTHRGEEDGVSPEKIVSTDVIISSQTCK